MEFVFKAYENQLLKLNGNHSERKETNKQTNQNNTFENKWLAKIRQTQTQNKMKCNEMNSLMLYID